jgi:hypothetical protein
MNNDFDKDQLQQLFSGMDQRILALQNQVSQHHSILERLDMLEKENKVLLQKNKDQGRVIEELRGQLFETQQKIKNSPTDTATEIGSKSIKTGPISPKKKGIDPKSSAPASATKWTEVVKRKRGPAPKVASVKQKEAISRGFNQVSGPQGYTYVYINRSRRFNRTEVRKNLGLLGVETSRILDVTFPARGIIGLLVHIQFEPVLKAAFAAAKVATIDGFDPTSPDNLADPKYAQQTRDARVVIAMSLHRNRCLRTLEFLRQKQKPVVPVAREFLAAGWIDDEDVSASVPGAFGDQPGEVDESTDEESDDTMDEL